MTFSLTTKSLQLRSSLCKCASAWKFCPGSSYSTATQESEKKKKGHIYSRRWKYMNVESTSKYLLEKIIYHEGGIVAINKPPDLGSSKQDCSIYHSLPFIAQELGYKYLKLVKVPEKSISGVTILAADAELAVKVSRAIRRSKAIFSQSPKQKFLALTIGHPISNEGNGKFAVKSQYNDKRKHSLILRTWTENERKRRDVNIGVIHHKVLAQSDLASLVEVSTWQEHENCPRVFLSDILLSPALGDQKFGARVSSLFEKPILLKPWMAPAVKALPAPLLKSLRVLSGSEGLIPMHFHLHEITLHGLNKDKSHLVLRAEPPDYFQWSCNQLNLELPTTDGISQPQEWCGDETQGKVLNDFKMISA